MTRKATPIPSIGGGEEDGSSRAERRGSASGATVDQSLAGEFCLSVWDENAQRYYSARQLSALLEGRDEFIVRMGLWMQFVGQLPSSREQRQSPNEVSAGNSATDEPILAESPLPTSTLKG